MTVIVCGSAMSAMTGILSGTSPLRGRAALDMPLAAFDYRQSRRFWGIEDPAVAFAIDAVVGGAPGYKDLDRRSRGALAPRGSGGMAAGHGA